MRTAAYIVLLLALSAGPVAYARSLSSGGEAEAGDTALAPPGDPTAAVRGRADTEKRLGKVEKRVGKIEKRVTILEESRNGASAAEQANLKVQPLAVAFISKKQSIGEGEIGVKLVLEFKNLTSYTINGFSGTLVLKPEGGSIYLRKISYSHPVGSGDSAQIELTISSDQTKQYLKFVKARTVTVVLTNQQLHE